MIDYLIMLTIIVCNIYIRTLIIYIKLPSDKVCCCHFYAIISHIIKNTKKILGEARCGVHVFKSKWTHRLSQSTAHPDGILTLTGI